MEQLRLKQLNLEEHKNNNKNMNKKYEGLEDDELVGKRIRLISMENDPDPIEPGTEGTVKFVDGLGQLGVKWDNGRSLSLIPDVDEYEIINEGAETVPMAGSGTHVGFGEQSGRFTKSAGQAIYGGDSPSSFASNSNATNVKTTGNPTSYPRFKDIKKRKAIKDKKNRLNNQIGADIDALSKPITKVSNENIMSFDKFSKLYEDGEGGGAAGGGGTATATLGNTGGMGAIVSAQPSSIPGDVAGSTKGSGDIGRPLGGPFMKQYINHPKKRKKKDKESRHQNQIGANIDKFYVTNYKESVNHGGKVIQSWKAFGDTK